MEKHHSAACCLRSAYSQNSPLYSAQTSSAQIKTAFEEDGDATRTSIPGFRLQGEGTLAFIFSLPF